MNCTEELKSINGNDIKISSNEYLKASLNAIPNIWKEICEQEDGLTFVKESKDDDEREVFIKIDGLDSNLTVSFKYSYAFDVKNPMRRIIASHPINFQWYTPDLKHAIWHAILPDADYDDNTLNDLTLTLSLMRQSIIKSSQELLGKPIDDIHKQISANISKSIDEAKKPR